MTSTRNGDATSPLRHFPTPAWAVDVVLDHLPLSGVIVDAGCGAGAILRRVATRAPGDTMLIGVELQEKWAAEADKSNWRGRIVRDDFLRPVVPWGFDTTPPGLRHASLVISNPPFKIAFEFLQRARELVRPVNGTVALLLRNDWGLAAGRTAYLQAFAPDKLGLNRRPQFRMGIDGKRGSDSCDYSWHVWGPGRVGRCVILNCPPGERRARKAKAA